MRSRSLSISQFPGKGKGLTYAPRKWNAQLRSKPKESWWYTLRGVLGPKPEISARVGKTGGKIMLPHVFIIRKYPFRYKLQVGFITTEKGSLCNACHHDPCECKEIKSDMQNSLSFKKDAREKKARAKEVA